MGIAAVIQVFVLYVSNNFTVEAIGLAILNAFLVAITAAGAHNLSQTSTANSNGNSNYILPMQGVISPQVPDISPPIITPRNSIPAAQGDPPVPPPTRMFYEGQLPNKADPQV
ncbi:MAG: hypothetical protein WC810_23530 [Janthinobacterium sp.]